MAGDWIKMRVALKDDPSVIQIACATGLDEYAVVGRLHSVWSWADAHTADGNADSVTEKWLDRYVQVEGFAAAMREAGWLEVTPTGLNIPSFDRHNGKSAKKRALTKDRVDKNRNAGSVTEALPEKRREEKKEKTLSGSAFRVESEGVLDYLNAKTGSKYQPVASNLSLISARLCEGATAEQCKRVIDEKVAEWRSDPKMSKYLRPETLFNATKFAGYAGQVGVKAAPQKRGFVA
jgi:uncharacterized phage protein (TIGR02220 family)